ncbi:MAG: IS91 family transposase [Deltaproteobacteria bacterium]|nr:IS91 family transposase [Deltaproteobacteria bacterium]
MADILRDVAPKFLATRSVTSQQAAALRAISRCRTAELGGRAEQCLDCGCTIYLYNSCRNRHCPRCQWAAQERWIEARQKRLLDTHHFHIVLTLPSELRPLALSNPRPIYKLLFRAASRTLLQLGRDPQWLGADLGVTMVLHTWARNLMLHPHVHCLVTGGGLSFDRTEWVPAPSNFIFPVHVVGALFRGKFVAGLRGLRAAKQLRFKGAAAVYAAASDFKALTDKLEATKWIVYSKAPMGGPHHVINYLGRYTHRVAISNHRLLDYTNGRVTLRTRGDATVTLSAEEFTRRFLLHVLPKGFMKIRHYGLFASANVNTKGEAARQLLNATAPSGDSPTSDVSSKADEAPVRRCPVCGSSNIITRALSPLPWRAGQPAHGARGPPLLLVGAP